LWPLLIHPKYCLTNIVLKIIFIPKISTSVDETMWLKTVVLNMTQGFVLVHPSTTEELSQDLITAQTICKCRRMFLPCIHSPRTSGPCSSRRMPHTCGTASGGGSAPAQHEHRRNPGHTWSLGP
jgi:hypothetical protein